MAEIVTRIKTDMDKRRKDATSVLHWIVIIIISQLSITQCASINPPVILEKGVEISFKEGDKLELKCQGDRPVVWSHSNLSLASDPRVNWTSSFHLSTLIIKDLKVKDTGVLYCRYNSPALSAYLDNIYVNVFKRRRGMSAMAKSVLSVLIVLGIILLLGLLIFRAIKNRMKKRATKRKRNPEVTDETENILEKKSEKDLLKGAAEHIDPALSISEQADLLPFESHWEFPRDRLQLGVQLGSGAFGRVVKAEAKELLETEPSTTVAVKMLKPNADESHVKALICELKIMANLGKHINVVNLIGACTKNFSSTGKIDELLVIVEYCKYGSLLNYIRRYNKSFVDQIVRNGANNDDDIVDPNITEIIQPTGHTEEENSMGATYSSESDPSSSGVRKTSSQYDLLMRNESVREPRGQSITTTDLLCWAFQIARGMEYLASRKVIHGDLATRNVLLADNNIVKICDFGLAKEMYKDYNYIMSTKGGHFPVKWMAVESIYYGELSTESDCWSFGVVLWELFSLGKIPYPGIKADEDLIKRIEQGYRMEMPEYAPSGVYKMMTECWAQEKQERPPFPGLVNRLGYMIDEKLRNHYIDLNAEYVRRNEALGLGTISDNGQTFPELDSYGYMKPIQIEKSKDKSNQSEVGDSSKRQSGNAYVADPTLLANKQNQK